MHRYTQSGLCVPLAAVKIIYKQQFAKKKNPEINIIETESLQQLNIV